MKSKGMVKANIPMRTCVGCMESKPKKELIRIVRTNEGEFSVDRTGRLNGRGAYICDNDECLNKAIKSKGLNRSFKMNIGTDITDKLLEEMHG